MIIWTGDSPSHDLWQITEDDVAKTIEQVTELIKEKFPGVPMYMTLGNHDFHPPNTQDMSLKRTAHLKNIASLWEHFIGPEAAE